MIYDVCDCVCDAVEVDQAYMVDRACEMTVKLFKPKSGVVIHTSDEEAKEAELGSGSAYLQYTN